MSGHMPLHALEPCLPAVRSLALQIKQLVAKTLIAAQPMLQ